MRYDIMDRLADWYEYHKMNEFPQSAEDIGKLMVEGSEEIGDLREENLNLREQIAEARLNWKLCEDQLLALREGSAEAIAILSTFHGEDDVDAFLAKHKEQT